MMKMTKIFFYIVAMGRSCGAWGFFCLKCHGLSQEEWRTFARLDGWQDGKKEEKGIALCGLFGENIKRELSVGMRTLCIDLKFVLFSWISPNLF